MINNTIRQTLLQNCEDLLPHEPSQNHQGQGCAWCQQLCLQCLPQLYIGKSLELRRVTLGRALQDRHRHNRISAIKDKDICHSEINHSVSGSECTCMYEWMDRWTDERTDERTLCFRLQPKTQSCYRGLSLRT